MAVDFGVKVEIISESGLQSEIDKIFNCLREAGIDIPSDVDDPGLAALIATLIRSIEKSIIAAYEPVIALVRIVIDALNAGIRAPIVFLEKVVDFLNGIGELLSNLPKSIIEFIVNKILEPIAKNINIPFPSVTGLIEILTGKVKINSINWQKWISEKKLIIPDRLKKKGEEKIKQVLTLFKSYNNKPPAFLKILELLLFPFKFAIGVLEAVIKKVQELVTNIFDTINELVEIASNPVQWVLNFIAEIFASILSPIVEKFIPIPIPNPKEFVDKFVELVSSIFKIGSKKVNLDLWVEQLPPGLKPIFKTIIAFIKILQCFIFWLIGLLSPKTILSIFGLNKIKFPSVQSISWDVRSRSFLLDGISTENINKLFKPNDKIKIIYRNSEREAIVESINGLKLITKDIVYSQNVNDLIEIRKELN